MGNKRYELFTRPCRQCNEPLTTTSHCEVVHATCRQAYYSTYQKKHITDNKGNFNFKRNRSRVHINEAPCAACANRGETYTLITKKRKFYNPATKVVEEYYLCHRCLGEIRVGLMEPVTWKLIDSETRGSGPSTPDTGAPAA